LYYKTKKMGVPAGTKFIGISASVDTVEKKSAQANSPSDVYTIEEIGLAGSAVQVSGTEIDFASKKIFNTADSPATGNITEDLTTPLLGIVQKIYHNDGSAPTVPAGWVLIGSGTYTTSSLNIIYAEWCGGSRVEYWIVS